MSAGSHKSSLLYLPPMLHSHMSDHIVGPRVPNTTAVNWARERSFCLVSLHVPIQISFLIKALQGTVNTPGNLALIRQYVRLHVHSYFVLILTGH